MRGVGQSPTVLKLGCDILASLANRANVPRRTFARKRKKKRSLSKIMLIVAVVLVVFALLQNWVVELMGVESSTELQMVATGVELEYNFDMRASFHSYGNRNFFFVTRDGIQNITDTGAIRWQHGFNLNQPILVGNGGIVAVSEPNAQTVYVFNADGFMYSADLPHPVLYYTVNRRGYLSVIMRTAIGYEIQVFNPSNPTNPAFGYRAPINDPSVFPWSVDVSDDGTYIAVALIDVETLIQSRLLFSYVRSVDSRGIPDGLIASYTFPNNEFILRTRFVDADTAIVLTDRRILGYSAGRNTQNYNWSMNLHNRLEKFYIGTNIFAYVTGDPVLNNPFAQEPNILNIHDFDGNLIGSHKLSGRATHLSISNDTILVGVARNFYAITSQGTEIWRYTAIQDVADIMLLDARDTILLAGYTQAAVMQLAPVPTAE